MGVEPETGARTSTSACPGAHDRVWSCSPTADRARSYTPTWSRRTRIGVCPTCIGYFLESWSLHGLRLSASTGWDASVSCRKHASLPGATPRGRRQPPRRLCGQHAQLPPLPVTRAMSMERHHHSKAAASQCAAASPQRREGAAPLARLESQNSSTRVHPPPASPTGGGPKGTRHLSPSR